MKIRIEGVEHDFDVNELTFGEGKALEGAFGGTMAEFGKALNQGSMTAMQLVVWIVLRRERPELRIADLDSLPLSEFDIVADEQEAPASLDPTNAPSAPDPDAEAVPVSSTAG